MEEMRRIRLKFVVICGVTLLLSAAATVTLFTRGHRATPPESPSKVWSIDLGKDPAFHSRVDAEEVNLVPPSLSFINEDQLISGFYEGGPTGSTRAGMGSLYHVLEISVDKGILRRKLDFDALEADYRVMPAADGGFLVLAGDTLQKYNNRFESKESLPVPRVQGQRAFDHWKADVSPTGNTLVLYSHEAGQKLGSWVWLATSDLGVVRSLRAPQPTGVRIDASDDGVIRGSSFDQILFTASAQRVVCSRCAAYFITDDLIFLDRSGSYAISTTDGQERWRGDLDLEAQNFARSLRTSRVAFVTGHYLFRGLPWDSQVSGVAGKIVVLDWRTNRTVARISWTEPVNNPSAGLSQMALALSPEGRSLAVLLHRELTLYRLPEPTA